MIASRTSLGLYPILGDEDRLRHRIDRRSGWALGWPTELALRSLFVHRLLGITSKVGLSNRLAAKNSVAQRVQGIMDTGLSVRPTGPLLPNPSGLLSRDRLREVPALLQSDYDHVILMHRQSLALPMIHCWGSRSSG
jgi:hypothetical protein